jgi:hypothetical protein
MRRRVELLLITLAPLGCATRTGPPPIDLATTCPTPYVALDAAACEGVRPEGYGLTPELPLEWGGAGVGPLWFNRLMCDDGAEPYIRQLPEAIPGPGSSAPLSALGVARGEANILDVWEVQCGERHEQWFVDVYHCGNPCPPAGTDLLPASAFSLYLSSVELARQNQRSSAEALMDRATELEPGSEMLWTWRGTLELSNARYEESLTSLERASELSHDTLGIQMREELALYEMGRFEDHLELLDQLIDELPRNHPVLPELYCKRGRTLVNLERGEEAMLALARSCAMGFMPCCDRSMFDL